MIDIKERLRTRFLDTKNLLNDDLCKEAADHIERQEALIAELHTSIAGAVQHGEQGWQRYESANKMCLNQQAEIAGLNEVMAELRKDEEQAHSILIKAKTIVEDLDVHDEITAFIESHTSMQEVG